jgi:hypothetical protein
MVLSLFNTAPRSYRQYIKLYIGCVHLMFYLEKQDSAWIWPMGYSLFTFAPEQQISSAQVQWKLTTLTSPSLKFCFQGLLLPGRWSTTWATPPALFCAGCFWTVCLGLVMNHDPPDSVSQVARIMGVSYLHLISFVYFLNLYSHSS